MRGATLPLSYPQTPRTAKGKNMTAVENAAKAEALKKAHHFTFDGEKYSVAPTVDWDVEVLEAVEDEKIVAVVRAILGEKQWTQFKAKKRKVEDLTRLFEAISKAAGLQGNS